MPIFEFLCADCGETSEILVLGAGTPACSKCSSENLRKLISTPAPQGTSAALIRSSRARAAREGHLSNYSASERSRS